MEATGLALDGTRADTSPLEDSSYPVLFLSPCCASVSSFHSDDSSPLALPKVTRRLDKWNIEGLSTRRYSFLCWRVVLILGVQLGMLLSTITTYICQFYKVELLDNHEDNKFILDVGLFGYSLSSREETNPQCHSYKKRFIVNDSITSEWLQEMVTMVAVPQMLAVTSPILALLGCIGVSLQMFAKQECCGNWSTSSLVFLAGLFQSLVMICFDGKSACFGFGLFPTHQILDCGYSTGFRTSLTATFFYFAMSVVAFFLPRNEAMDAPMEDKPNESENRNVATTHSKDKESCCEGNAASDDEDEHPRTLQNPIGEGGLQPSTKDDDEMEAPPSKSLDTALEHPGNASFSTEQKKNNEEEDIEESNPRNSVDEARVTHATDKEPCCEDNGASDDEEEKLSQSHTRQNSSGKRGLDPSIRDDDEQEARQSRSLDTALAHPVDVPFSKQHNKNNTRSEEEDIEESNPVNPFDKTCLQPEDTDFHSMWEESSEYSKSYENTLLGIFDKFFGTGELSITKQPKWIRQLNRNKSNDQI